VTGQWNKTARVGGVLVSKQHFASGRFEVVMKIGTPKSPRPAGMVPAIWIYGYRMVKITPDLCDDFNADSPLYHPYLQEWGKGMAFYDDPGDVKGILTQDIGNHFDTNGNPVK
jgi:hypothetical protein